MIYTSLAVLAMSASAAISPLSSLVHLHPHRAQTDDRISLTLYNKAFSFRDITVDGHTYTVEPQHELWIKAPAGTAVYAASRSPTHRRGDLLLEVTSKLNKQMIDLN